MRECAFMAKFAVSQTSLGYQGLRKSGPLSDVYLERAAQAR